MNLDRSLLLAGSLFLLAIVPLPAAEAAAPAHARMREIAGGGPFVCSGRRTQRFAGKFRVASRNVNRRMTVALHNGVGGRPGFTWLRVFLGGNINMRELGHYEEPAADLLMDDDNVQKHIVTLDISEQVRSGVNTLIIEGRGPRGATISWFVQEQASPRLSSLNPSRAKRGARLLLHGQGFSVNPLDNEVTIGGNKAEVLRASPSALTVRVPEHLSPGDKELRVSTGGLTSAPYTLSVQTEPRVYSIETKPGANGTVVISGVNLSPAAEGNQVYFNDHQAVVVSASPDRLVVSIPPEIIFSGGPVEVSVTVDGVPAGSLKYRYPAGSPGQSEPQNSL